MFTYQILVEYDGSNFSGWQIQKKGQTIEVPSSRSSSINVLGFVNRACQFESFAFEGSPSKCSTSLGL